MLPLRPKAIIRRQFLPGQSIFRQGEDAAEAYLIEAGKVRIYVDSEDGKTVEIATLGEGEIFGEMALMRHPPVRSANAEAVDKTRIVVITYHALHQKLEKTDPIIKALFYMFIKRIEIGNALKKPE